MVKGVLVLTTALILSACGSMNSIDDQGNIKGEQVKWGNIEKTTFKTSGTQPGMWKSKADLDMIQKGMNKAQLYELMGRPHYREGFRTREWNYVLNKNTPTGVAHCQLKILYDNNMNVANYMWNPVDCMVEKPTTQPVVEQPVKQFKLRADFLFDFDKSTLTADGSNYLRQVANEISNNKYNEMVIVGHTDRLGSEEYNRVLSEKRAMTVAKYLIDQGAPSYKMQAFGAGKSSPVKECAGEKPTAELKACLADNRRVEISVK